MTKPTKRRTVRISYGTAIYTAYEGASKKTAQAHIDTARNVLVLAGATATIDYREDDRLVMVQPVVDGTFTTQHPGGKA